MLFCFYVYGHHRDLHVLTHSFPTRRSSDLLASLRLLPKLGIDDDHRALAVAGDRLRSFAARLVDDLAQLGLGLGDGPRVGRSEEHTSELQSLMRISYAVFCLKKKKTIQNKHTTTHDVT